MLEIRNRAGMVLDLPVDSRLTIEINSTIFDTDDIIRGSYSYPFQFGLNENNLKFIEFGHLPETPLKPDLTVTFSDGAFSSSARMTYRTSGFYADATLLIDIGVIADVIRNKPLREYVTEKFLVGTIEGAEMPSLLALANANPGDYPIVFPPFYNPNQIEEDFKPTDNYVRTGLMNKFYPDSGSYLGSLYGSGNVVHVPMVYVNWLISYICKKLGFSTQGSLFSDPDLSRLIIFNTQSTPGNLNGVYTVEVGRHLGDITIGDFFKAVRAYMGVSIDLNTTTKKATFNVYRSTRQKKEYVDVSEYFVANSQGNEPVGAGGFVVTVDKDERDNATVGRDFDGSFSVQRENTADSKFTIGTGGVDVSLKIGTTEVQLFTVISNNVYTSVMMLSYVDMPGNLADPFFEKSANFSPYVNNAEPEAVPALINDFGLRFLIYWGMQQDSKGNKYPYASPVSYDSQYKVFGKLSLRPGEPDDIWNRYQKPYYEFLAYSTRTTALLKISIAKLSEVSPNDPIGLRLKNYVLGRYILEKLTYELPSNEGFVLAKFEGRQLNPKLLRALPPSSDLFLGIWVKFVIENFREVAGNGYSDQYGDVVLLAYLDGNFTIPAPAPSLIVNYKVATLTLNTNGQSTTTYKTSNVTATQSRTVLEHDIHLSTTLFLGGWKLNNAWIIQNGAGYRTRL